jgi:hypothetical protein
VYHAHAYEIAGYENQPHIRARRLEGWHRDEETISAYSPAWPYHISVFVYLTDVDADGGAFEFCPEPPGRGVRGGRPAASIAGAAGTTFVWNRSFVHRASPNRSSQRRRILKLSWQPAHLPNDRIGGAEIGEARGRAAQGADTWTTAWLGGRGAGDPLPAVDASPPRPVPVQATGTVRVSRRDEALERAWSLRHLVRR